MNFVLKPWQFALIVIAGWMNREQQEVIEYLRTENSVLREKRGKRRIRTRNSFYSRYDSAMASATDRQ